MVNFQRRTYPYVSIQSLVGNLRILQETTEYYKTTTFAWESDMGFWFVPPNQHEFGDVYRDPYKRSIWMIDDLRKYLIEIEDALIGHYMVDVEE